MFKNFRISLKKSGILIKIRKAVQNHKYDANSMMERLKERAEKGKLKDDREIYKEELLTLLSKDKAIISILKNHNKDFDDIRNMIKNLEANGARQIVRGHYIPASSIAFGKTLNYLCQHWNGENFEITNENIKDSNEIVACEMITSF